MQVAICDDERIFIEQLHEMVEKTGRIEKCDLYDNPDSIRAALRKGVFYDIVFMDIDWKREEENGIQYAAEINRLYPETNIIFTTSYNERFSQEIFWETVNLCGYLVKPVQERNLVMLFDKFDRMKRRQQEEKEKSIIIPYKAGSEVYTYREILYLESKAHQVIIHTKDKDIVVYEKLNSYEEQLKDGFVRVHQSYLVNMQYIKRIDRKELLLQNDVLLPVSKSKFLSARDRYFAFIRSQI